MSLLTLLYQIKDNLRDSKTAASRAEAALALTPTVAYVFYNRGRVMLALDRSEEARADFNTAADTKLKQPGARKLAREALSAMQSKESPSGE